MGGGPSFKFKPLNATLLPFFPIIITIILIGHWIVVEADDDTKETPPPPVPTHGNDNGGIATTSPTVSESQSGHHGKKPKPFKPSTVVVVCVLTTMFSTTFIILLYIKHCNGGNPFFLSSTNFQGAGSSEERKNSGVDRAIVESLPIFRFGSLRGQKEGLDCAVCLTRFGDHEVLRLLPKCNHAFHVECVDMWLDAHSTCPLCRYKVDPKDIIRDERQNQQHHLSPPTQTHQQSTSENEPLEIIEREINNNHVLQPEPRNKNRRVSGRHSSVGEMDGGFLQIVLQTPDEHEQKSTGTTSYRRSFDSASGKTKGEGIGRFIRPRKDGTSLTQNDNRDNKDEHRLEHRIIVSPGKSHGGGFHQHRWSDVEPSDLLYLTSEMIISGSNTCGGRRTVRNRNVDDEMENGGGCRGGGGGGGGGVMMNLRSVSEITGMSRFLRSSNRNRGRRQGQKERHEGVVSRWKAWISVTHPHGAARIQS